MGITLPAHILGVEDASEQRQISPVYAFHGIGRTTRLCPASTAATVRTLPTNQPLPHRYRQRNQLIHGKWIEIQIRTLLARGGGTRIICGRACENLCPMQCIYAKSRQPCYRLLVPNSLCMFSFRISNFTSQNLLMLYQTPPLLHLQLCITSERLETITGPYHSPHNRWQTDDSEFGSTSAPVGSILSNASQLKYDCTANMGMEPSHDKLKVRGMEDMTSYRLTSRLL